VRETALDFISPDRTPTDDEADLLLTDLATAMRVQRETMRPLHLIGHREYTRWRAWFLVEAATQQIREIQMERRRRRKGRRG
jgi:hypothetical protein